jgi:hypothetical protein
MIEVGRVAGALVERVAEHAALRRPGGHVKHQLVAPPHQLVIHRLVAHAGLDHGEAEPLVDLEDAVHSVAEIDYDLSRARSGTAAEPDIVAGADRIERHAMRVGAADDLLHVGGRGRVNHAGRPPIAAGHGVLGVTAQRLLAAVDGGGADRGGDFAEERFKRGGHDCPRGLGPHQIPVLAAASVLAGAAGAGSRSVTPCRTGGFGPPAAQSSSSTVCTIGQPR